MHVNRTVLAEVLTAAEYPCGTGCRNGWIDNMDAVRAWRAEHQPALDRYDEERRRKRSAWVGDEESALRDTEPRAALECPCGGTGFVLTPDGQALMAFVKRHWGRI